MLRYEPVVAQHNFSRMKSITLYGAIGRCLRHPVFMFAESTDEDSFRDFLAEIARGLIDQYSPRKPFLVLDNHRAHKTDDSMELMEPFFVPMFQPAYSSCFNS